MKKKKIKKWIEWLKNECILRKTRALFLCLFKTFKARHHDDQDFIDHMDTLFLESLTAQPKVIVELGVRGGESTFVLEKAANFFKANLISVDIDDCTSISRYKKWHFVQKDDIQFAQEFTPWCEKRNILPAIDILFIDTSHEYNHTVKEIEHWFPLLSKNAKVFFHDTNMGTTYTRKNGAIGKGWDNDRGVIRAIEEYFNTTFNEKTNFAAILNGFFLRHYTYSNGLTILEKLDDFSSHE